MPEAYKSEGLPVLRVAGDGLHQFDLRIALFAALIAAAALLTALHAFVVAREHAGRLRVLWVLLAGSCAGAGIWATHFLAVRVYGWGMPLAYDPLVVALALLTAVGLATAGFAVALPASRLHAAAGGSLIGLAVVATHVVGLHALSVADQLLRDPFLAVPLHVGAVAISGAGMAVLWWADPRFAVAAAASLLALAVCAFHFAAVGAVGIVPGPLQAIPRSYLEGQALAIVIACTTALTMVAARVATIIRSQWSSEAATKMRAQHNLLQDREDELKKQITRFELALTSMPHGLCMVDAEGRIVICNKRYADIYGVPPELTKPGTPLAALIDHRIANGIYVGGDPKGYREERLRPATRPSVKTCRLNGGRTILITRRPTADGGSIAIHEDITDRRRLEEMEREAKETLAAVFNAVPAAIICLSPDRRVLVWSRGAEHIFGYTASEVIGQPYKLVPPDGEAEFEALFRRTLAGETLRDVRVRPRRKDGSQVEMEFSSAVVRDPEGTIRGIVCALDDLTELEKLNAQLATQNELLSRREAELQSRNLQLDTALEHMLQGLAMFDSELRLVLCNRLYADMYGLTPDQVKPGTPMHEIFENRISNGTYHVSDEEAFVASWTSNFDQRSTRIQELADGRVISVSRGKTADGGRVATHDDITERQRLMARLQEQHQLLKQQEERLQERNLQLDAALNNMAQGLAMFDSGHRVVIANKRYAEIYGLTEEQVKPGTHLREILEYRIANGDLVGKSADEILSLMLARIEGNGQCQYIARLTDGRYVSVSAKPMPNGYTVTTHEDITEQRRSEAKIVHMAMHDALTGLPNRVLFNERLEQALARIGRGEIAAVHLLDLDHFKNVNDTLGHPAGDKLLKVVTERLCSLARETDTVARMGGDEFAILQMSILRPADASSLARRVIETLSEPYEIEGQQVLIGASIGIAIAPSDGQSCDQLIRNADLALYRGKSDGRGVFTFFEPHMDAQMQERRSLEYDMRKALVAGEFELLYQPVVNLESNRVNGCEALIRWRHPVKGLIPPSAFIPLAEELGFIIQLGDWAIREACATAARWPDDITIAVNLSPVQFRSSGLLQSVVGALASSGLAPNRLELEITETILLENSEATLAVLYQLRELGVRIAMDDFGTGYSSLSYLQSFPFDRIKIDRSFVKDIGDGVGSRNIVRAVVALASGLGMETTAEGVETEEQRETVKQEGCTEMQGYLFSQPRPAEEIESLYFGIRARRAAKSDKPETVNLRGARAAAR